jgi:hypothetical protein
MSLLHAVIWGGTRLLNFRTESSKNSACSFVCKCVSLTLYWPVTNRITWWNFEQSFLRKCLIMKKIFRLSRRFTSNRVSTVGQEHHVVVNWFADVSENLALSIFKIEWLNNETKMSRIDLVRIQVLTAASVKMVVFWDVALCSLVEVYRRFRGACCLPGKLLPDYTAQQPRRQSVSELIDLEKNHYC